MQEVGSVNARLKRSYQNCLLQMQPVVYRRSHYRATLIEALFLEQNGHQNNAAWLTTDTGFLAGFSVHQPYDFKYRVNDGKPLSVSLRQASNLLGLKQNYLSLVG